MRNYALEQNKDGFVVGVSGGLDSAVASSLAARTGLTVLCMQLPIHQAKDEDARARAHCTALCARYAHVRSVYTDLSSLFDTFAAAMGGGTSGDDVELARVNTKSRLRLAALYYHATAGNLLVIGTGNRVEQRGVGFFAKYGDGPMDMAPLTKLTKSQVHQLGEQLGVERAILKAPPTDGLWPDGRTDLDQIGATYPELEWAMDLREGQVDTEVLLLTERQKTVLEIYDRRHADNRHKRIDPPEGPIPASLLQN